ncbi:uncharacterized protein LOC106169477 [Lingula anatina]|uniref:Uncharacterized protein LOC106169477 n=1 Tax=Lingula anatina TaxID=7574 RepID=A0A1S3J3F2_LINAN|nr:uncharacterized protein LOC106169477 [Lingula anatina]|eukprot:XP_013404394.1 uncharacterized protein LOC106169477 [Lingula anatina]
MHLEQIMSQTRQEQTWNEQSDSLRRIREQLAEAQEHQPRRHSAGTSKRKAYDPRQTRTPPALLPRLDTPPDHDQYRQSPVLRGSRYGVVPPVGPRQEAYERSPSTDSWGDDSDGYESRSHGYKPRTHGYEPRPQVYPVPYQYPYPQLYPYPYPAVYPIPSMVYPPPPPVPYYLQAAAARPKHRKKHKSKHSNAKANQKDQATYTIEDRATQYSHIENRPFWKDKFEETYKFHTKPTQSRMNGVINYKGKDRQSHLDEDGDENQDETVPRFKYISTTKQRSDVFDDSNSVIQRYKYDRGKYKSPIPDSGPAFSQQTFAELSLTRLNKHTQVAQYFNAHNSFAQVFVEDFIQEALEDEIVPDLLIEVVSEQKETVSVKSRLLPGGAVDLYSMTAAQLRDLDRDTLMKLTDSYLMERMSQKVLGEDIASALLSEVVHEGVLQVVKLATQEMVSGYLAKSAGTDVMTDLVEDYIAEIGHELVEEVISEVQFEDVLEEFIEEDVDELANEVAVEVLTHYDTRIQKRELREVAKYARQKFIDSMCSEYYTTK